MFVVEMEEQVAAEREQSSCDLTHEQDERVAEHARDHSNMLRSMARRLAGAIIDPDDLLNDAWVSVLVRKRNAGVVPDSINAYVIATMRNRVIDISRKHPRLRAVNLDETEIADSDDRGARRVDLLKEVELIHRAIALLPDEQARVLLAVVVEQRKPGAVAQELGASASKVYSLLHRAKASMRKQLFLSCRNDSPVGRDCNAVANALGESGTAADPSSGLISAHLASCTPCANGYDGLRDLLDSFQLQTAGRGTEAASA